MERKTQVQAAEGKQELTITREFELPVELLFRAYAEPEIIEQWMGTKVLAFNGQKFGNWQYATSDKEGKVVFSANGTFHEFVTDQKITRTFEMENTGFGIQLEFLNFEALSDDTSKLTVHILYGSPAERDQFLKIGMDKGMNMAHNRLQQVAEKLK
ncbi:SRPBCC domain-containing protein [Chitinophaga sp. sic0106]|uniref:SRPBCC domain-containing protein n=1 Tax=Chitinophaga sp. sic0106 TaxID=2854785 RepID=UPI001C457E57|nr:SRPBCC domain-containing protein [Chitinophaga sp. sic0106]MBV7529633.1 SRPBCC domain-containing protein [Chitinophaga sp. sic0106]